MMRFGVSFGRPAHYQASTLMNKLRQVAGAAGVAVIGTLIGSLHAGPGNLTGFRAGFAVDAVLMAAALAFAARVSDSDAAPTMADAERGASAPSLRQPDLRSLGP